MELRDQRFGGRWGQILLQWVNLRPEEAERTFLMFAFYTATSVGVLWLEASTVGLFLDEYGAEQLPWIYISGAVIGSALGALYTWLQSILPLRRVIVLIALIMAAPLLLFRVGLGLPVILGITVFLMRLWLDGIYVLNDLNTSITANQLFNIREIKRTYPIISSGILLADVVSGFSLPFFLNLVGLNNVILMACLMMVLGAGILYYLSQAYQQAFPDSPLREEEDEQAEFANKRLRGPIQHYVVPLIAFFVLAELLNILVDFQFLSELEQQDLGDKSLGIAAFIGVFNGFLGIFELVMQWFVSSRLVERMGVFGSAIILPAGLAVIGLGSVITSFTNLLPLFSGLVVLKFFEELLHYTLFEGVSPVLFQPIPEANRDDVQAVVNGIAEPLSDGVIGLMIFATIWFCRFVLPKATDAAVVQLEGWIFVGQIVLLALAWVYVVWMLRSRYVGLLVSSAERGRLGVTDVDLRVLKRAVVDTLEKPGTEADKRSCIELLTQIDPNNVGEVLAPLLVTLPPALQRQSLETMLNHPSPAYLPQVRALIEHTLPPEVLALGLRYVWLTEKAPDIQALRPYLQPQVDPVVRGTAASLIMRRGNREQKAEATNALRRMLTHKQERERVMGCRALGEADYLQGLRLYIPNLLQDESLRVRCALLDVIASTHLEEYYPSLLRGLYYKSTREAALRALVRLDNEIINPLVVLAEDAHKPDLVRMHAWSALGQIGTREALDALASHLMTAWGTTRRNILRILLKMPQEAGIEGVLDRLGRSGVETLIDQELRFLGQLYAALVDLPAEQVAGEEAELLRRALRDLQADAVDRLFLLMKFLYPHTSIQAASFNLKSGSRSNMARGLEILDNTLDIPTKRALLSVLDRREDREKLQNLSELLVYQPMTPSDRLRRLLELRHFLSDWPLACCFHLARSARWSLTADQTLACLRHPRGLVRESVLAYLGVASPRALVELLPMLQNDPDRLVAAQVKQMMAELAVSNSAETASGRGYFDQAGEANRASNYPGIAGFEAT
ncbi:HEAT repeat domain-containing protein [Microcoleus sp. FACHB-68]|uniref:HEAT repeat domain-containing protein n=1 Tax=Microcoleus sp. FACHB-68 TaxID=2692826 RepID=UPI0016833EB1|nr:HEAT repeat domain-containing protein [Microcoleus sp. FACHB-68]MBD1938514.1 HEAT repeat domain-containing protein [Microcoleus sp. FACHB-68]